MRYDELRKGTKELKGLGCKEGNTSDVIREMVEKGIEKGRVSVKVEVARMMLGRGFDINEISECLGLSVDDVKAYVNVGC